MGFVGFARKTDWFMKHIHKSKEDISMENFGLFAAIIGMITVCAMLFYLVARAIDYVFTKKTNRQMHGYRMAEIGHAGKQGKAMCKSMVKHINDGLLDMCKRMEDL
jgi:hypothetical protein